MGLSTAFRVSPVARAALGGGLLAAAFLPGAGPTAVVLLPLAFVPWIDAQEAVARTGPRPFSGPTGGVGGGEVWTAHARVGAAFAGTFWALNLLWVPLLVPRIGAVWPLAAWVGQVLLLALVGAGAGVLFGLLRWGHRVPAWAAGAGAWMTGEWVRGTLLGPLRFPWAPTALPLGTEPALLQPAAWGGEWLLGVGVVAMGGLLARALRRRRVAPLAAALVVATGWYALGAGRMRGLELRTVSEAVVVQPALPLALRRSGADSVGRVVLARTDSLIRAAEAEGLLTGDGVGERGGDPTPLVILPETHLPRGTPPGEVVGGLPDGMAADLLVGAFRETGRGWANSLLLLSREAAPADPAGVDTTAVRAWYDKRALVPGVEWGGADGLVRGRSPAPLSAPGRPGALICVESAWTGLARSTVAAGAGWLVNVTNDAWLAEGPTWTRTPAFGQHPAHLRLRAVETGRGVLRVANNGWTGSVTPTGRWIPAMAPHRPGVARVPVMSAAGAGEGEWLETPYTAWGHRLPAAGSLVVLLLAAAGVVRIRRCGSPEPPHGPWRSGAPVDPP